VSIVHLITARYLPINIRTKQNLFTSSEKVYKGHNNAKQTKHAQDRYLPINRRTKQNLFTSNENDYQGNTKQIKQYAH
jgi:hypothetical protein